MHQKNEEGLSPASAGKTKQELDQMNNEELMALYKRTGDNDIKWALAMRFQEPLRRIAMRTCGAYGGMNQLEDVIHEGLLTLLNAMDRFDPEKGVKLETYVAKRLRGIVIDLGRKQDWMPRQLRQKSSRMGRAEEELSMTLGREPTDREVAEHLGLSLEEYEQDLSDTAGANLVSFEMLLDAYGNVSGRMLERSNYEDPPEEMWEEKELRAALIQGIQQLRPNEQMVLSLYYEKELTMKEIAQVLGVSPPRVSQIHSHAIQRLRVSLKEQLEQ